MNRKPSIVLVTTSFPVEADGREAAGSFVADFCDALGKRSTLTVMAPSIADHRATFPHFALSSFRVPALPLSLLRPTNPFQWLKIMATLRAGRAHLEALCNLQRVDHIFCLWSLPGGHWARAMKLKYGIPYSTWSLGSDIWTLGRIPVIKNILSTVLRDGRYCFADGLQLKNDVERLSGRACEFLPSSRRLLDGPCLKEAKAAPPYKLAYLGRWHPNKGIDLLGQALEGLGDASWDKIAAVRIAGGGPLGPAIRDHVARLQGRHRPVKLEGYKDKAGAQELLRWADFVIIPSRIESIPVIFSDAMQARCAVVANPVGDLPQLISQYGVGVAAASIAPADLSRALETALARGPTAYAAGIHQAAAQFRVDEATERLIARLQAGNDP